MQTKNTKILNFLKNHKKNVLIFVIFFLLVFNMSFLKIVNGFKHKKALKTKIVNLEKDINFIKKEIYNLTYNAGYIELLARKNLAMYKKGETIYRFSKTDKTTENNSSKDAKYN
jgi:cell division protein FtsB